MAERYFDEEAALALMSHVVPEVEGDFVDPQLEIIENGEVVGEQEWDSGGPGAGAGSLVVYRYAGKFFALDDVEFMGPYDTFREAAEAVGLFVRTGATTGVYVKAGVQD
jgi:hypothetical protein